MHGFLALLACRGRARPFSGDYEEVGGSETPDERPPGVSEIQWNAEVASGKAMTILSQHAKGYCGVETGSVYGRAVALPQFARTAEWSQSYTGMAIRAFIFLFSNVILQAFLLYMISTEERIVNKFGGQMHLCDFAADISSCPGGMNCIGPGGTSYTAERLYDWKAWSTRVFVRESLKLLFPDRADEIGQAVDPGEYGLENYRLRIVCCLLFVMGLWPDLRGSIELAYLLWHIPTKAEPWMEYVIPTWDKSKEHAKAIHGWSELDLVKFRIAGMPLKWKAVNALLVLSPKLYLWFLTADIGVVFLMETSVIEDMIINAVALSFILSIDELIVLALGSPSTSYMLEHLERFPLFETSDEEDDSEKDAWDKHQEDKQWSLKGLFLVAFPFRLCYMLFLTSFFILKYYIEQCVRTADGSWISKDVHLPLREQLPVLSFIFGPWPGMFPVDQQPEAVWTMPGV